ncbi:hypothetical protein LCGC14_1257830 [marine sediment metagenome]|uniref:Uncharacterized protein n=1 Tax=marine sediment metagenome TaxID=412755 RepID=A0A0F9L1G3_9ZZZZ
MSGFHLANIMDMLFQIKTYPTPLDFSSLTPREAGFQYAGGCGNGRAFMGNLRRVKKSQRRRAHLRSLRSLRT